MRSVQFDLDPQRLLRTFKQLIAVEKVGTLFSDTAK